MKHKSPKIKGRPVMAKGESAEAHLHMRVNAKRLVHWQAAARGQGTSLAKLITKAMDDVTNYTNGTLQQHLKSLSVSTKV